MKKLYVLMTFIALSACTQAAAPVVTHGDKNFRRDGGGYHTSSQYYDGSSNTTDAPVLSQNTENVARTSSVGITDLSPPTQNTSQIQPPQNQPQTLSMTHPTPPSKPLEETVNPWTQKPRDETVANAHETVANAPQLPAGKNFIWPVSSTNVTSSFGPKSGGKANDGITIKADQGEPVWAAADGEVVYANNSLKGYGNMVLVKHKGGKTTTYANLSKKVVDKYDRVKQGDIIGYIGSTGNAKSPQLYFAVREGTEAVDPLIYVSK